MRRHKKYIHEGQYVAEVDIEVTDPDDGWSPYISLDDALKLDDIRQALRNNDIKHAGKLATIFTIKPVAV
jgi:hypothetical protein